MSERGRTYDARFAALEASGHYLHGEADLVDRLLGGPPARILDAGCGTGRVAIELARRGYEVLGVDRDPEMLEVARQKAPHLSWWVADLSDASLAESLATNPVDLTVLAGNVLCFLAPGTLPAVARTVAASLRPGGLWVAGFQLPQGAAAPEGRRSPLGPLRPPRLPDVEQAMGDAGLQVTRRLATWEGAPFSEPGEYVVLIGHRPDPARPQSARPPAP
jgi:SAM-dependent methyltransferase